MIKKFTAAILFLFSGERIFSQELPPIQTDRPDQTECPFIVPKNHFQMETGYVFEKDKETVTQNIPASLLKFGLSDNFELRLIVEEVSYKDDAGTKISGIDPVQVGFKANICKEHGIIPTTSFIGHISIPDLSTKDNKTTYYAPAFRFTMQNTLSDRFVLGYNLGAEWDGESAEPVFIYTITTGFSISEKMGCYVEAYGFSPQKNKADHRFDGGLTYLIKKNIQIDASAGAGITENAPDYFWGLGLSFRIPD